MKYLLDTNICIYAIKHKPASVLERLLTLRPTDVAISIITVAELEFGIKRSSDQERNKRALDRFLVPFNVIDFDYPAAIAFGSLRAELAANGKPIDPMDTLIAAHAISKDLILVTNNEK